MFLVVSQAELDRITADTAAGTGQAGSLGVMYQVRETGLTYVWDPAERAITLAGGLTSSEVAAVRSSDRFQPADLDFLAIRSSGEWATLSIPSPYSPAHVLHPSVLHFPAGWRGYRYWMAYTPYPASDAEFENPCVCASMDGESWVAVGTQPLVQSPAGTAFNSDTDLAYDATNDALVLLFRDSGVPSATSARLHLMVSQDGRTWTNPVQIYAATDAGTASSTDIASPSLMYNATAAKWEVYGHNIKDSGSAWPFVKITSSNLLSGWDTSLTAVTFAPPSGRKLWHSQIRRLPGGAYIGLVQDNSGTVGGAGNLLAAYSADGATFTYRQIEDVGALGFVGWYRPSFVIVQDLASRDWVCQAYGSRLTTAGILYQVMRFDAATFGATQAAELSALLSGAALGSMARSILHADTFNRGDDATGLGTASGGGTYTQPGGPTNVIGISSNQAYNVTTGNCRALRDMGVADYLARVTIVTKSAEMYLVVRYVDSSNYTRVGVSSSSGQLKYQVVTSGSIVVDTSLGTTPANGDEISVRCCGGEIVVSRNGRRVHKAVNSQGLTTGTFIGMQMAGTLGGRLDNLLCTAIG